ncbi:MAG: hypothetical protein HY919_04090 [Elusimicrobia bacterium]|nr:hypothetical protein [Elusimicrobiota bacterium]
MQVKSERLKVKILWLVIFICEISRYTTFCEAKNDSEIGVIIGKPVGISGKCMLSEKTAIDGVFGFGSGFMAHLDYLWHDFNALKVNEGKLPFYYGVGALVSEKNFCVQGKLGLEYLFDTNPLGIFIEIAPAVGTDFIFQGGIGVRYRLK